MAGWFDSPSLFSGKAWSAWKQHLDKLSGLLVNQEKDGNVFMPVHHGLRCSVLLKSEDMLMFGHCQTLDESYFVVCELCGDVLRPHSLKKHIGIGHNHKDFGKNLMACEQSLKYFEGPYLKGVDPLDSRKKFDTASMELPEDNVKSDYVCSISRFVSAPEVLQPYQCDVQLAATAEPEIMCILDSQTPYSHMASKPKPIASTAISSPEFVVGESSALMKAHRMNFVRSALSQLVSTLNYPMPTATDVSLSLQANDDCDHREGSTVVSNDVTETHKRGDAVEWIEKLFTLLSAPQYDKIMGKLSATTLAGLRSRSLTLQQLSTRDRYILRRVYESVSRAGKSDDVNTVACGQAIPRWLEDVPVKMAKVPHTVMAEKTTISVVEKLLTDSHKEATTDSKCLGVVDLVDMTAMNNNDLLPPGVVERRPFASPEMKPKCSPAKQRRVSKKNQLVNMIQSDGEAAPVKCNSSHNISVQPRKDSTVQRNVVDQGLLHSSPLVLSLPTILRGNHSKQRGSGVGTTHDSVYAAVTSANNRSSNSSTLLPPLSQQQHHQQQSKMAHSSGILGVHVGAKPSSSSSSAPKKGAMFQTVDGTPPIAIAPSPTTTTCERYNAILPRSAMPSVVNNSSRHGTFLSKSQACDNNNGAVGKSINIEPNQTIYSQQQQRSVTLISGQQRGPRKVSSTNHQHHHHGNNNRVNNNEKSNINNNNSSSSSSSTNPVVQHQGQTSQLYSSGSLIQFSPTKTFITIGPSSGGEGTQQLTLAIPILPISAVSIQAAAPTAVQASNQTKKKSGVS